MTDRNDITLSLDRDVARLILGVLGDQVAAWLRKADQPRLNDEARVNIKNWAIMLATACDEIFRQLNPNRMVEQSPGVWVREIGGEA